VGGVHEKQLHARCGLSRGDHWNSGGAATGCDQERRRARRADLARRQADADRKTLYIAARTSVYRIRTNIAGIP